MKGFVKAILFFFIPLGLIILWVWSIWEKIKIDIGFKSLDVFSLAKGLFGENEKSTADFSIDIDNQNGFDIKADNLYAKVSYNNKAILESSDIPKNKAEFTIPANGRYMVIHTFDVLVNDEFKNAIRDYIGGTKLKFEYYVRIRILLFGFIPIPIWWTDTFEYGG